MALLRAKTISATASCALALAFGGCMSPWPGPLAGSHDATTTTPSANVSATMNASPAQPGQAPADADMSSVVDKLRQVRSIDPAAEQKLLDELRRTPASSWPLVAEQFRASLAFHEQLKTRDRDTPVESDVGSEPRLAMREGTVASRSRVPLRIDASGYSATPNPAADISSTPIGTLADPHHAVDDNAPIFANSSGYSLPIPVANSSATPSIGAPAAPTGFTADVAVEPATANTVFPQRLPNTTESEVVSARLDEAVKDHIASRSKPGSDETNWQQLVDEAADDLSTRVADSPTTTAEVHQHVSLRILWLLAGNTEKALEPIPGIAPAEQDFWSRQLFALATYLDHHAQPDDKRRAAASVTHLDQAVSQLRELGSLSLRNLAFCKNVYGYGAIEVYEKDSFSPGQQVTLYIEIENYHSKSTEKGYCTSLGSTYEITDETGTRVAGDDFPDVDDCCRTRRRDFHIQYGLKLPQKIAPGKYQLQLVVKDRQGDKMGHTTAAFEIHGATPSTGAVK